MSILFYQKIYKMWFRGRMKSLGNNLGSCAKSSPISTGEKSQRKLNKFVKTVRFLFQRAESRRSKP